MSTVNEKGEDKNEHLLSLTSSTTTHLSQALISQELCSEIPVQIIPGNATNNTVVSFDQYLQHYQQHTELLEQYRDLYASQLKALQEFYTKVQEFVEMNDPQPSPSQLECVWIADPSGAFMERVSVTSLHAFEKESTPPCVQDVKIIMDDTTSCKQNSSDQCDGRHSLISTASRTSVGPPLMTCSLGSPQCDKENKVYLINGFGLNYLKISEATSVTDTCLKDDNDVESLGHELKLVISEELMNRLSGLQEYTETERSQMHSNKKALE